jgi:hypothetical protein
MPTLVLDQKLLENRPFWKNKSVDLPQYNRQQADVKSLCFSAGRMAYGHTGDILQDLLNRDPGVGVMVGVETYAARYCADLAASDYLMTQLIFGSEKGQVFPKIQGAIQSVLFWTTIHAADRLKLLELAATRRSNCTINAPESVYGVVYSGGEFAEPVSAAVKREMAEGTVTSDPASGRCLRGSGSTPGCPSRSSVHQLFRQRALHRRDGAHGRQSLGEKGLAAKGFVVISPIPRGSASPTA